MIRLGLPKKPRWLALGDGVRVKVRPLTTAVYEAARASGRRKATALAVEQGLIEAAGGTIADLPDSRDRDGLTGLSQMLFAQALAVAAVLEWEGVGDAEGKPAAPTADNVETMIRDFPGITDEFLVAYTAPLAAAVAEGNGSGAAPSGTSTAAPSIADRAEPTASPAPTADGDGTASGARTTSIN